MSESTPNNDAPKPTAGPWLVEENDGAYVTYDDLATLRIVSEYNDLVVALVVTDIPQLQNRANAEHIVKCVNTHDDLVAALLASYHSLITQTGFQKAAESAHAALKKTGAL